MSTLRSSSCRTNFLSALRGACAKPIVSAFQDGKIFCFAVVTGTAIAFFLHWFPMAQPPSEAPDRNHKKKVLAKHICSALQDGKTFCFAVAAVTGTAIAFSSLFSHGPATR